MNRATLFMSGALLAQTLLPQTLGASERPESQIKNPFNITASTTNATPTSNPIEDMNKLVNFKTREKFNLNELGSNDITLLYFGLPFANPSCNGTYAELDLIQDMLKSQYPDRNPQILAIFPYAKNSQKPLNNLFNFQNEGLEVLIGSVSTVRSLAQSMGVTYSGFNDGYPKEHDKEIILLTGKDFTKNIKFSAPAVIMHDLYGTIGTNKPNSYDR